MHDYKKISEQLKTISAIPINPFDPESKEIQWDGVKENLEFLIKNQLKVVVPCGNTSEFYALTLEEAKETVKRTVEIVDGRALVVAGVGYAVETAIELGNYAKDNGADLIMIHMPVHPYITDGGAVNYFKEIIENVDLPAIIYFKDPALSDDVLKQLAPLDRLVGVKYAINDLPRFAKVAQDIPKELNVRLICGTAEKWAPFYYNCGAEGFTSGLVNVFPQKSLNMLRALEENDTTLIWKIWRETVGFEDLRAKYNNGNNVAVIKETMKQLGLTAGVTREPVDGLNDEDKKEVTKIIESWGLTREAINT